MRNGYSLLELTFVLMVTALLLGIVVAPVRHARDVVAVRAARAELASLIALTRSTAIAAGGASAVIDIANGTAWMEQTPGSPIGDVNAIAARHRVSLTASQPVLRIRYDALGIGRISNATIRVKSGSVTGTLTISSYGRVRVS